MPRQPRLQWAYSGRRRQGRLVISDADVTCLRGAQGGHFPGPGRKPAQCGEGGAQAHLKLAGPRGPEPLGSLVQPGPTLHPPGLLGWPGPAPLSALPHAQSLQDKWTAQASCGPACSAELPESRLWGQWFGSGFRGLFHRVLPGAPQLLSGRLGDRHWGLVTRDLPGRPLARTEGRELEAGRSQGHWVCRLYGAAQEGPDPRGG